MTTETEAIYEAIMNTEYTDPTEIERLTLTTEETEAGVYCPDCGEPTMLVSGIHIDDITPRCVYRMACSDGCDWSTPWFPSRREARESALAEYALREFDGLVGAQPAPVPEPTALQLAQEAAQRVADHWYVEDNLVKMRAYAAVAQAEALTRIAEVLETWLEAGINPRG